MSDQRVFAAPVSPWAATNADLGKLRARLQEAETALRHAEASGAAFVERTRLEQQVRVAKRELEAAEFERTLERRREQVGYNEKLAREGATMNTKRYVGIEPVPYFKYKTAEEQRAAVRAAGEEFNAAQRREEEAAAQRRRTKAQNVPPATGSRRWRARGSLGPGVHKG